MHGSADYPEKAVNYLMTACDLVLGAGMGGGGEGRQPLCARKGVGQENSREPLLSPRGPMGTAQSN